ncbi:MAG: hypothetical protein GY913_21790 [Proteobacteria bacterium]|nr:hypothetical protein [Actinomycetes bacterium]MCP4919543.1 hypothetical protein [Pseudomonadota bacterium]
MFDKFLEGLEVLNPDVWAEHIEQALSQEGIDAEEVGREAAQKLDDAIDFTLLLPAPAGQIVEMFDDKIFEAIIVRALEDVESPEEREAVLKGLRERLAAGSEKRQERRRARRKPHKVSSMTPGHTD